MMSRRNRSQPARGDAQTPGPSAPPALRLEHGPLPPAGRGQKWALAAAVALEVLWIAALVTLAVLRGK